MTVQFEKLDGDLKNASAPFGVVAVSHRSGIYRNFLKRVLDVSAVLLSLPITLPVIFVMTLLVARDGHNPFYKNVRVGRGGRDFKMLKLRTMVPNADQLLDAHLESNSEAREEWRSTQKLKCDPRITKVGRFLRKTSLDELPQLWNVLVGDMSLVGPRPMFPAQRVLYPGMSYYFLRPGITGRWQVSERNDSEFCKRAEHDHAYDTELSFRNDVKYLIRTVGVVLKGTGY